MVSETLKQRLLELHQESPLPERLRQYVNGSYKRGIHFGPIKRLAKSRGLIPVVLYTAEGIPQLLDLEDIANADVEYYIGRVIKEQRELLGLEQQELAKKSGTYPTALSRYENCKVTPTVDLFEIICQHIGLRPEYLTKEIRRTFGFPRNSFKGQLPSPFDK